MCNCILELPAAGRLWLKIAVKKFVAAFCNPIQSYWTRLDGPSKLTAVCLMDFSRSPIKMKAFKHKTYSNIESFEVPFLYYVDRKLFQKKTSQLWGALTVPQGSFFSHRLRALWSLKKGGGLLSHQQGAKVCQHLAICHSQPWLLMGLLAVFKYPQTKLGQRVSWSSLLSLSSSSSSLNHCFFRQWHQCEPGQAKPATHSWHTPAERRSVGPRSLQHRCRPLSSAMEAWQLGQSCTSVDRDG